jgi:hypothetical protein
MIKNNRITTFALTVCTALLLTACGDGINHSLVTSKDAGAYKESLNTASVKMNEHELKAFNWAVQDFDLERLNKEYSGATPKTIIRGEVAREIKADEARIPKLKKESEAWNIEAAPLRLIVATETSFFIDKNFFGDQPKIKANIVNKSGYDISAASYYAELYIDERPEPVASTTVSSDYKNIKGFKNNSAVTSTYTIGFVTGDKNWTTLEIANAKKRIVKMSILPSTVLDFGGRALVGVDPGVMLKNYQNSLDNANSYKDI